MPNDVIYSTVVSDRNRILFLVSECHQALMEDWSPIFVLESDPQQLELPLEYT